MKYEIKHIKVLLENHVALSDNEDKILLDYITNLQTIEHQYSALLSENAELENRIKELETINEEHRRINGELRKTINEAIDYIKSHKEQRAYYEPFGTPTGIPNRYEYFVKGYYELLEILQGKSDE